MLSEVGRYFVQCDAVSDLKLRTTKHTDSESRHSRCVCWKQHFSNLLVLSSQSEALQPCHYTSSCEDSSAAPVTHGGRSTLTSYPSATSPGGGKMSRVWPELTDHCDCGARSRKEGRGKKLHPGYHSRFQVLNSSHPSWRAQAQTFFNFK